MATPQLTLQVARQSIRDALANNFTQDAFEGSVPSAKQLKRISGAVYPYIVYRFPDPLPTSDTNMAGPQGDAYIQLVNFIAIAPDVVTVESLYMKLNYVFIGFQPTYSGPMTKRGGTGTYPVGTDNSASEAWVAGLNFGFTTSLMAVDA